MCVHGLSDLLNSSLQYLYTLVIPYFTRHLPCSGSRHMKLSCNAGYNYDFKFSLLLKPCQHVKHSTTLDILILSLTCKCSNQTNTPNINSIIYILMVDMLFSSIKRYSLMFTIYPNKQKCYSNIYNALTPRQCLDLLFKRQCLDLLCLTDNVLTSCV